MFGKKKKYTFICTYILLLIIELFFYVPYEKIVIFLSDKNVPHTEIIGNGYETLDDIRYDNVFPINNGKTATGKRVDSGQLLINLSATTIIALFVYLIFIYSGDKSKVLQSEFELLQRKVDILNYDNQLLQDYKKMFLQLKNALTETANISSMPNIKDVPTIDINALAFADEETQDKVLQQYTDNISAYTAYKIYNALKNEMCK